MASPAVRVLRLPHVAWILYLSAVAALSQATDPEPLGPPSSPDVTFYMYPTPDSAEEPITEDIEALIPSHPLTMVFHGFKGDSQARSMLAIKEALMQTGVNNVVLVDWGRLADHNASALTAYNHVRDHGVSAAAKIATAWLRYVLDYKNISPQEVHLVGFSLGAHLVGIVGHMLNSTVGRITGLDPPKFGYEMVPLVKRIDKTDGRFVNVIHTSAGILSYTEAIAHVDFFPNGDVMPQQGCPHNGPLQIITCSHYFSFVLFVESVINHNALVATECSSWTNFSRGKCDSKAKASMGYATPNTTRGVFYMKTKSKPPYGVEDPENPLTEKIIDLMTFRESDGFVHASDVVNFLMNKDPSERSVDGSEDLADLSFDAQMERISNVMRVKGNRQATTTPDPPAFIDNSSTSNSISLFVLFVTFSNIIRTMCSGVQG